MEPDLDRLLDFESTGSLFPQFLDRWKVVFEKASQIQEKFAALGDGRLRVCIKCSDSLSFSALFVCLCRSDIDLFFLNPSWGSKEIQDAEAIADPHWVLGDFEGPGFFEERRRASGVPERENIKGFRAMIATGGTSGRIKFAMHDWRSLSGAAYGVQMHFECSKVSSLCMLPLYHVSGFMQLVRAILSVGKIVFCETNSFKEGHDNLFEEPDSDKFLSVVPTQLSRLVRSADNVSRLRYYRAIFVGGGPVPVGLVEECRELKLPLALTYGMTETAAQVSTLRPDQFLQGRSDQGTPLPHANVDIVDAETHEPVGREQLGCIRIFATSLFRGYYGEEEDDGQSIITADLGRLDGTGHLMVMGRMDRVIISGGEKINLREIEMCVEQTNLVSDVAAFSMEDPEWGQRLGLGYVPKEEFVTEEAIKSSLGEQLVNYKSPKFWLRLAQIPRNDAGKLKKDELLQQANI